METQHTVETAAAPVTAPSDASSDQLIAEYQALRAEVISNSQIVAQIFALSITGVAALVGFGVQFSNWYIFLVPAILLLPALLFISSQLEALIRIAAYINVFIEPDSQHLRWETALSHLRLRQDRSGSNYLYSILGIYLILIALCLGLAWLFVKDYTFSLDILHRPAMQLLFASALITGATLVVIGRTYRGYSGNSLKDYHRQWQQVRDAWPNQA